MLVYLIELLQQQQSQSAYLTSFREVKYLWLNVKQAQPAGVELKSIPAEPPLVPIGSECVLGKNVSQCIFSCVCSTELSVITIMNQALYFHAHPCLCIIVVALGINIQLITQPTALSTCPLTLLPHIPTPPYSNTPLFTQPLFCNYPILQLPY